MQLLQPQIVDLIHQKDGVVIQQKITA